MNILIKERTARILINGLKDILNKDDLHPRLAHALRSLVEELTSNSGQEI